MRVAARNRAFSLVELMVVLGLILILVGLAIPALRGARQSARMAVATQRMASLSASIIAYAGNYKDIYPVKDGSAARATTFWYEPMIEAGFFANEREVDPTGRKDELALVNYTLSMAMVFDPAKMMPGHTVPIEEARSQPVGLHEVLSPGRKGVLAPYRVIEGSPDTWCCIPFRRTPGPIAWADGSVSVSVWQQALQGAPEPVRVYEENGVGLPVLSTWGGFLGVDR